jgi:hypothetical protein
MKLKMLPIVEREAIRTALETLQEELGLWFGSDKIELKECLPSSRDMFLPYFELVRRRLVWKNLLPSVQNNLVCRVGTQLHRRENGLYELRCRLYNKDVWRFVERQLRECMLLVGADRLRIF